MRRPEPNTDQVAQAQTQRAAARLASGEALTAEDRQAEGRRRMLASIGCKET